MAEKPDKKKKEDKGSGILNPLTILFALAGAACGVVIVIFTGQQDMSGTEYFLTLGALLLSMYLAMFVQIVLHESGHLIFGLMTGYRFFSFKIANLMLYKKDGKMCFGRMSIAGTGGQCLMEPPQLVDGQMPFVLYNLGGCIMNLVTAAVFLILYIVLDIKYVSVFLLIMVIMGLAFALGNGIPIKTENVNNDGSNVCELYRYPEAARALWIQISIAKSTASDIRLKDMPEEWFVSLVNAGCADCTLVTSIDVFRINRLMDKHEFSEALKELNRLFASKTVLVPLYRRMLICDKVSCELLIDKTTADAEPLRAKEQASFMKKMSTFPSVIRTEYICALLLENDSDKAAGLIKRFKKVEKSYPYKEDINGEREVMELAEQAASRFAP